MLSSVLCEHQYAGGVCVSPMDRIENVFRCVRLHSVAGAAIVVELLSAAVDVHHAVARFPFLSEGTRVLSAWSFASYRWPGDTQDYFRRVLESTLEEAIVVRTECWESSGCPGASGTGFRA